jgi:hypothetical protein
VAVLLNAGRAKNGVVYLGKEPPSPEKIAYVIAADAAKLVRLFMILVMPNPVVCTREIGRALGTVFTTKIVEDKDESERDNIAIHAVYATVRWRLMRAFQKAIGRAIER